MSEPFQVDGAEALFGALESSDVGLRWSMLRAVAQRPERVLAYGPHRGESLVQFLERRYQAIEAGPERAMTLQAILVLDQDRLPLALDVLVQGGDPDEVAVALARLAREPAAAVQPHLLKALRGPVGVLVADRLVGTDLEPADRVAVAVRTCQYVPVPALDDATRAAWNEELRGPCGPRVVQMLQDDPAFGDLLGQVQGADLLSLLPHLHNPQRLQDLFQQPEVVERALQRAYQLGLNYPSEVLDHCWGQPDLVGPALRLGAWPADPLKLLGQIEDIEIRCLLIQRLSDESILIESLGHSDWRLRAAARAALARQPELAKTLLPRHLDGPLRVPIVQIFLDMGEDELLRRHFHLEV